MIILTIPIILFFTLHTGHCILNGQVVRIESVRYLASVRKKQDDTPNFGNGHICGGVLIHRKAVLTAASCLVSESDFSNLLPNTFRIVGGSISLNKNESQFVSDVDNILTHPKANYYTLAHNLAIMILSKSVLESDHNFVPLFMPIEAVDDNEQCTIAGWGKLKDDPKAGNSVETRVGRVLTVDLKKCKHPPYPSICITANETTGPCGRDTGGPVIFQGRVVGIIQPPQRGIPCDVSKSPTSAVHVFAEIPWITDRLDSIYAISHSMILIICDWLLILAALLVSPELIGEILDWSYNYIH